MLEMPRIQKGRALLIALGITVLSLLGVGLAIVALQPDEAPWQAVKSLLFEADWVLLIAGMLAMCLGMLFVAIRWRCLLPDKEGIGPFDLTGIVCSGLLMNYAVPGPAGEFAAAYLVRERHQKPATVALAASLHARFIGLGTAGVLAGLIGVSASLPIPAEHQREIQVAIALITIGALGVATLSAYPSILVKISGVTVGALSKKFQGRIGRLLSLTHKGVSDLAVALGEVGRLGFLAYAQATLWALLAHLSVFIGIAIACSSMGIEPYLPGILLSYCAATAAVIALIAFPGSQLGWDLFLVAFLKLTAGLSPAEAWAVVVVVRAQQLLLLILGAGFLMRYTTSLHGSEENVQGTKSG